MYEYRRAKFANWVRRKQNSNHNFMELNLYWFRQMLKAFSVIKMLFFQEQKSSRTKCQIIPYHFDVVVKFWTLRTRVSNNKRKFTESLPTVYCKCNFCSSVQNKHGPLIGCRNTYPSNVDKMSANTPRQEYFWWLFGLKSL